MGLRRPARGAQRHPYRVQQRLPSARRLRPQQRRPWGVVDAVLRGSALGRRRGRKPFRLAQRLTHGDRRRGHHVQRPRAGDQRDAQPGVCGVMDMRRRARAFRAQKDGVVRR